MGTEETLSRVLQELQKPDYATPALYFFSTVAQTMGAIIAIVLASIYAIVPQIQQRNEKTESSVLIRLLQKDTYFISSMLFGFSSIIISIASILCVYVIHIQTIVAVMYFCFFAIISLICMIIACVYIWLFITKRVKMYSTINNLIDNKYDINYMHKKDILVDYIYVNILYYSRRTDVIHNLIEDKTFFLDELISKYGEHKFYKEIVITYLEDNMVSNTKNKNILFSFLIFIYFHINNLKLDVCNNYILGLLYSFKFEINNINDVLWNIFRFDTKKIHLLDIKSFIYNRLLFYQSVTKYFALESEKFGKDVYEIMMNSPINHIIDESLRFLYQQDQVCMFNLFTYIWVILLSSEKTIINDVIIRKFYEKSLGISKSLDFYKKLNSTNIYQGIEMENDTLLKMKQISALVLICYMFGLKPPTEIIIPELNSTFIDDDYSLDGGYELSIRTITNNINRIRTILDMNVISEQDISDFLNYDPFGKQNN